MKTFEINLGDSLKFFSKLTTEGSSMTSTQFETEVAQDLKKSFADYKYEVAKVFGKLRTLLSESILGTEW